MPESTFSFRMCFPMWCRPLARAMPCRSRTSSAKQAYHHEVPEDAEFLTRRYFNYFEGREFTEIRTYLIVTQEVVHSQFVQYDPKKWMEFHSKISKVDDILTERNIRHRKLTKEEVEEYCHRFMAFQFRHGSFAMTNFKASDEYLKIGGRVVRSFLWSI